MSVITTINRLIHTSVAGLYQALLASGLSFQAVANRLIKVAENAHAFRQYDRLQETGEILSNFPLKQYQYIGQYYLVVSMCRNGQADIVEARPLIDKLATFAPLPYRARAMQLLAATYGTQRNPEQELYLFTESLKTKASTFLGLRGIALIKAKEGYHEQALKDLESLYPLARLMPPHVYFDYLNSLAVELWEVGRKYEARNVIRHVLESPLIIAYPEWRETADELREPNRSFIVIDPSPARMGKLLSMPAVEYVEPTKQARPAPIINLESWKAKMGKKKNGDKTLEGLDSRQLLLKLMELGTAKGMTDDKLLKVIDLMEKLLTEPQKPDGDEPGT